METLEEANACELSIVMPCLNEGETIGVCIEKAQRYLRSRNITGEVIVADNGSSDGSREIAASLGAKVTDVQTRGYGAALMGGILAARGRFVIMGDADDSYDFTELDPFVRDLRSGVELVMGNRFKGGIGKDAMRLHHRFLGNPVLSAIGRAFFGSPVGDFHCGLRGFDRRAILDLDLNTTGMEFASEMIVKATLHRLNISEVPTTLSAAGRSRPSHLDSWRDGWRHLRFLLLYSPRWLFLYPGLVLSTLGLAGMVWLVPDVRTVGGIQLDVTTLLYCAVALITGVQCVLFALFSKALGIRFGALPPDRRIESFLKAATLERVVLVSVVVIIAGIFGSIEAFRNWSEVAFGRLNPSVELRIAIPSATAIAVGLQGVVAGFFIGIVTTGNSRSDAR